MTTIIKDKLQHILSKAQQNASCHQKYLKILENLYNTSPFEEFCKHFVEYLELIFSQEMTGKGLYMERCLDFCAKFCVQLAKQSEKDDDTGSDISDTPHPFLSKIIQETLQYHDLDLAQARYYSCKFIMLLLQNIGNDTHMDNDMCDKIQEAMLERILDPKTNIRLQAITALVRLQEPLNPDCPVIKAYSLCFNDNSASIRKEVVSMIAPNSITIPKVKDRVRDVDHSVRSAAFRRCADIGPKLFKIVDRQSILQSGFSETNVLARQVFLENLIPKWLTAYNGDFLQFLSAIKLDADEEDIKNTADISAKLMEVFFKSNPIRDIICALPVEDKLIPLEKLSTEVVTYWCITTNHLRSSEDVEECLDMILPELTHFSNYIDRVLKHRSMRKMDEWEFLDFQYILMNLFEMAEKYDFSDEVGRKHLNNLILNVLQHYKFSIKLISKLVRIAEKLSSNTDSFTHDICQIISDIREPLVDEKPSAQQISDREFRLAEINVKINIISQDQEDAIERQDFKKAAEIKEELVALQKKHDELQKQPGCEKVKVTKDDPDTICRCLDILISILQLPSIKTLSDTLRICKDEFVMPLLTNNISEIHWRVLKCLTLFCIIDKATAEESAKIICIPIAMYRTIPNYNKSTLTVAVEAVSDLIRLYTANLLCPDESESNTSANQSTRRRLYRNEDMEESTVVTQNKMNVEFIIEIILDMLDDENDEIRNVAVEAVAKLIMDSFPVSPTLISRLILKWYSPLTEKQDIKLQQKLGVLIERFTDTVKGAKEIIEKAVIPTLSSIANAPKTSPLADIDVDNVLRFLALITDSNGIPGIVNVHQNLSHTLCNKIASKPHDCCVPYMAKMLLYLDIPVDDDSTTKELLKQAELLLEDVVDKAPKRNITKFITNLNQKIQNASVNVTTNQQSEMSGSRENETVNNTNNANNASDSSSYTIEENNSPAERINIISNVTVPNIAFVPDIGEGIADTINNVNKNLDNEEQRKDNEDNRPCSNKSIKDAQRANIDQLQNAEANDLQTSKLDEDELHSEKDDQSKKNQLENVETNIAQATKSTENLQTTKLDEDELHNKKDNHSRNNQLENVQKATKTTNNNKASNKVNNVNKNINTKGQKEENKNSQHKSLKETEINKPVRDRDARSNNQSKNKRINNIPQIMISDNDKSDNERTKTKKNNVAQKSPSDKGSSSGTKKANTEAVKPRQTRAMACSEVISTRSRFKRKVSLLVPPLGSPTSPRTPRGRQRKSKSEHDPTSESDSDTLIPSSSSSSLSNVRLKGLKSPATSEDSISSSKVRSTASKDTPRTYARKQIVVVNIKSKDNLSRKKRVVERNNGDKLSKALQVKQIQAVEKILRRKKSQEVAENRKDSSVIAGNVSSPKTRGKKIDFEKLLNLSPRNKNNGSNNTTDISAVPIAESTRNRTRNSLNSSNEENTNLLSNLNSTRTQVKRKKHRPTPQKDSSLDDSTVLHTIVEQTLDTPSRLEDSPFSTPRSKMSSQSSSPLTRQKTGRNVVVATNSSDSELSSSGSIRRSARKLKKKKYGDCV